MFCLSFLDAQWYQMRIKFETREAAVAFLETLAPWEIATARIDRA